MPRKHDFVSMWYRIDSLPGGRPVNKRKVLTAMLRGVETGSGNLPKGMEISWAWRNKEGGEEHLDDFRSAVQESRAGFLVLMERRIRRDIEELGVKAPKRKKVRTATEAEIEEIEEIEEELEEERRARASNKRSRKPATGKEDNRKSRAHRNRTRKARKRR